ncbi:MAG: hypothetical protein VR64_17035 [Desulfatitalea sp. BRH_c12]|nr:MAG: hypothetical protein VR64_17035 [Desulfatitalea sp. BRH_c12]
MKAESGGQYHLQAEALAKQMRIATVTDMMQYLETLQELPTLSSVAMRVNGMLMNTDTTAHDLAQVIEKDQSIASKLLKLANSSFFGFSSRVSSVAHAVMILGFNSVRNAVLSMAVIDAFSLKHHRQSGFDLTSFWRHSISVAVIGRYLGNATKGRGIENVFTAGILHDIGKVVMAIYFPERFIELKQSMDEEAASCMNTEHQFFPIGHSAMGAFLVRCWNLPVDLVAAIAQHHHPELLPREDDLLPLVHAADAIVNIYLEKNGDAEQWPICQSAWRLLGDKIQNVHEWLPAIEEEIQHACQVILDN